MRIHVNYNHNLCFAGGHYSFYCGNKYKFVSILNKSNLFQFSCNEIPEITLWCIENKCMYGWALYFYDQNSELILYNRQYTLYIASDDEETCMISKLMFYNS